MKSGANQFLFQLLAVKGNQRIQVAFSADGFIENHQKQDQNQAGEKAPQVKQKCENQQKYPEKFQSVAEFIARLGIIGDGNEGHIQKGLHVEPPGFHREITENNTGDHAQSGGQAAGRV